MPHLTETFVDHRAAQPCTHIEMPGRFAARIDLWLSTVAPAKSSQYQLAISWRRAFQQSSVESFTRRRQPAVHPGAYRSPGCHAHTRALTRSYELGPTLPRLRRREGQPHRPPSRQIFTRVEAGSGCMTQTTRTAPLVAGTSRLRGVLDHHKAVRVGEVLDTCLLGRSLPEQLMKVT